MRTEQAEPRSDWARFALDIWRGDGRVERVDEGMPPDFLEYARAAFERQGFPVKRIRTWVNVMPPEAGEGYAEGYPHVHANDLALTMVHYLQVPEGAPALDVFEGNEVVETIEPKDGMSVFIPNGVWHGVRKNNTNEHRIAFIATAYP